MIEGIVHEWLPWLIGAAILAVLAVIVLLSLARRTRKPDTAAYMRNLHLLTATERSFLRVLEPAAGERCRVFAKIAMSQLIAPRAGTEERRRRQAQELIRDRHFDFVVCDRDSLSVVCVIELHDEPERRNRKPRRDSLIGELCRAIGLPYAGITAQSAYSLEEIRACLDQALGLEPAGLNGGIRAERGRVAPANAEAPIYAIDPAGPEEAPKCPKCGSPTIRRRTRAGDFPAREFWGCIRFPKCRGMVPHRDAP